MPRSTLLGASLIAVAVLTGVCYGPAILGKQFAFRDAAHFYYPLYQRVEAEWDAGRIPLWEPEENGGMPLLGNPTAAVLYPGKVLFRLMPYPLAARWYVIAHTLLATAGAVVLARALGIGGVGSVIAGSAYGFGGPILFQYCNIIYLVGAAWMPWALAAVDAWLRRGRLWAIGALAVALAMQVLGGEPQSAYLAGLCAGGYALVLARAERKTRALSPWAALGVGFSLSMAIAAWVVVTLTLAWYLPIIRPRKPQPPTLTFEWNPYVPLVVAACWGLAGLWLLAKWRSGRRDSVTLGRRLTGLAAAAGLAGLLASAQLLPVVEFAGRTGRAADEGSHDIYPFSLEPYRVVELLLPNVFGTMDRGNHLWLNLVPPRDNHKIWINSLYLRRGHARPGIGRPRRSGGAAVATLDDRRRARLARRRLRRVPQPDLARAPLPLDGPADRPARPLADQRDPPRRLPPRRRRQPVSPAGRGVAGLRPVPLPVQAAHADGAGPGHARRPRLGPRRGRRPPRGPPLGRVPAGDRGERRSRRRDRSAEDQRVDERHRRGHCHSALDLLKAATGDILAAALQSTAVLIALSAAILAWNRRPRGAAVAVILIVAVDLAMANHRFIAVTDQSAFESVPKALQVIADAEKAAPSNGPYRVHRMPFWQPSVGRNAGSPGRYADFVHWERDTLQPKYGINEGVHYTFTHGVAELYDYEWFFAPWTNKVDPSIAHRLGVDPKERVVYYPRRGFDLWGTRYFILPGIPIHNNPDRGIASFTTNAERIYPPPGAFEGPEGAKLREQQARTEDLQILRNRDAMPRAWVVHGGRVGRPIEGLSRAERAAPMEEMLYMADPLWYDPDRHAEDPRTVAWLEVADTGTLRRFLPGGPTAASEAVTVREVGPTRVELDVTLERPGIVVLADVFYPGWTLTIDDKPAPVLRANRMMRGAAVEAGPRHLVYEYRPPPPSPSAAF